MADNEMDRFTVIAFVKGSVVLLSTIAATVAALETREIATNISDMETKRLIYDTDKFTADILYKHLDVVATSGVTSRCIRTLLNLNTDDFGL